MTLIHDATNVRMYISPGSNQDGYVQPDWTVREGRVWHGGAGEWLYVGDVGSVSESDPPTVYATRLGVSEVLRRRDFFERPRREAAE